MKKLRKIVCALGALALIWCVAGCAEEDEDVPVEAISIQSFGSEISLNNEYYVSPNFTPSDATNKGFTISVDDSASSWVTIDNAAKIVEPTKTGTFTLTVTSTEDSSKTNSIKVTVNEIPLTGISFSSTYEVYAGRTTLLTPVFTPSDASYKNVEWSSADETIATVDELGNVTGVKEGTVKITVKSQKYENVSAEVEIKVIPVMPV